MLNIYRVEFEMLLGNVILLFGVLGFFAGAVSMICGRPVEEKTTKDGI